MLENVLTHAVICVNLGSCLPSHPLPLTLSPLPPQGWVLECGQSRDITQASKRTVSYYNLRCNPGLVIQHL